MLEILKKWKKRLNLTDWRIDLKTDCIPGDFVNQNVVGECTYEEVIKSATIKILKPACYSEKPAPNELESTLVHELLHIKFCLLEGSGNALQDRVVHQLIEEFARILVEDTDGKEPTAETQCSDTPNT